MTGRRLDALDILIMPDEILDEILDGEFDDDDEDDFFDWGDDD